MELTADHFIGRLEGMADPSRVEGVQRYFRHAEADDRWIGARMGDVLTLTKQYVDMPFDEVERLLESTAHEARVGGVKILARKAARRRPVPGEPEAAYELYLRRHDRINNWDLVDLGAWDVVGRHLLDRDRAPLYRLAESPVTWERRTAQLAPLWFLRRRDEVDDALALADRLAADPEDLVNKATGWAMREVARVDPALLDAYVRRHAAVLPAITLRYAAERLPAPERARLRALRRDAQR